MAYINRYGHDAHDKAQARLVEIKRELVWRVTRDGEWVRRIVDDPEPYSDDILLDEVDMDE